MRIDKAQTEIVRNDASRGVQGADAAEAVKQPAAPSEAPRADSVQISDAGRALAQGTHGSEETLSTEKLHEMRELVVACPRAVTSAVSWANNGGLPGPPARPRALQSYGGPALGRPAIGRPRPRSSAASR